MKRKVMYIICILFSCIIGIFIGKLNFNNKKDVIISNDVLSNKKYILNIEGNSYIKFNKCKYEYRYKKDDQNYYNTISGTYELNDNTIKLDNNINFIMLNDKLVLNDSSNKNNLVYFDIEKYANELIKFKNTITEYVDDIKKLDANLAYPKNVKVDVLECFNKNEKFICSINYYIYFDNYIKSVCDELEKDKMFFPYAISNGTCESSYIKNWSYFELENKDNNYKLIKTYDAI